jgi:hypothetical protein
MLIAREIVSHNARGAGRGFRVKISIIFCIPRQRYQQSSVKKMYVCHVEYTFLMYYRLMYIKSPWEYSLSMSYSM